MTNLTISDEERDLLRSSIRRLLAQQWPIEGAPERSLDSDSILKTWRSLCELGISALGADTAQGGMRELIVVFEELGRASFPGPLLGPVLINILQRDLTKETSELQKIHSQIQEGSITVAICFGAFDGDVAAGDVSFVNGRLTGRISFVEDVLTCSAFLVFQQYPARIAIVRRDSFGINIDFEPGLAVPSLATVTFHGVDVKPESLLDTSDEVLSTLAHLARMCYIARAVGSAWRAFELAVEHAKVRKQFGQFIGQFQAVQHKLADCLTGLDGARLTLAAAATAFDLNMLDWRTFAAASAAYSGHSLRQAVLEAHHVFAAIGYAEEHELPRHFRRVHADVSRFGGVSRARAELADYLLGPQTT